MAGARIKSSPAGKEHAHRLLTSNKNVSKRTLCSISCPPINSAQFANPLEVIVDAEDGEVNSEDRAAILAGLHSIESQGTVSMEEVLSDFGLTLSDFERDN